MADICRKVGQRRPFFVFFLVIFLYITFSISLSDLLRSFVFYVSE